MPPKRALAAKTAAKKRRRGVQVGTPGTTDPRGVPKMTGSAYRPPRSLQKVGPRSDPSLIRSLTKKGLRERANVAGPKMALFERSRDPAVTERQRSKAAMELSLFFRDPVPARWLGPGPNPASTGRVGASQGHGRRGYFAMPTGTLAEGRTGTRLTPPKLGKVRKPSKSAGSTK